jgi:lysophospholipase L1-like esterase
MGGPFGRFAGASCLLLAVYACDSGLVGDASGTDGDGGLTDAIGTGDGAADLDATVAGDGAADAAADAALPPSVRFIGRRDATDAAHPKFGWPGARIVARFTGTEVSVTLAEQSLFSGPSHWDVLVDGSRTSTLAPTAGTASYAIAQALPSTTHTIELYRRTEGTVGITQFLGFTFPNGGKLLSPPPAPPRRIELIGDSMTAGYGNECMAASETFAGATENERLAFSGLVAHDLAADHHDVSFSGKGVLLNYKRSDSIVFDQLYERTMPLVAANDWAFTSFTPDVVWIMLGGNDWDQDSSTMPAASPPDVTLFTNKYIALAARVRAKYPGAHVFCAIAPSMNDDFPAGWNALTNMRTAIAGVVAARKNAGDAKIYAYEFNRAVYPGDLTGCGFHANLGLHRKMADEAIAQIKAKTKW